MSNHARLVTGVEVNAEYQMQTRKQGMSNANPPSEAFVGRGKISLLAVVSQTAQARDNQQRT
jgi:hypothetical protein